MGEFENSVFINCPFDKGYRPILVAVVFTVKCFGLVPRLALDEEDAAVLRLNKIIKLIEGCRYGIHDLSRMKAVTVGEFYRMNMPFELGIDFAAKSLDTKVVEWRYKKLLILESNKFEYKRALSDISGCDIKSHQDNPREAIKAVRDWFVVESKRRNFMGAEGIWNEFVTFNGFLSQVLIRNGHKLDEIEDIPIPEVLAYIDEWLANKDTMDTTS